MDDPPGSDHEAQEAKRILIVEDEAIIALAESFMLRKRGYIVDTANSGEAALSLLAGGTIPDLILMDIDLGQGMDGTAAASAILERWKLPIVFLTSHSSREMVEKVRGITRYGYIIKNSGDFVMMSTIDMAFDLFSKERLIEEKNALLKRAEIAARIGYWFVSPGGGTTITLSEGSRAILGLGQESCSFEDFQSKVLAEASESRARAFRELIENGRPYDITYRIRRSDTGAIVTIRSSGRLYEDTVIGVFQDISEIEGLLGDLREGEARQAVTLRSIGDGVISTDTEGRVVELNRMAEELTGWRREEAFGRPIGEVFEIVNASSRKRVENPIQKVMETGYIVGLANHTVLIARGGAERHIADSAAPIRDEGGAMLGMVLVFRDISRDYEAQEMVRRSEGLFRALFTDGHTPMMLIDPEDGKIEEANRASERFYGWDRDELRSMNISEINVLPPQRIAEEMGKAAESDYREFHFIHRVAEGEPRHVLVVSGPIRIDGKKRLLSIIRDATEEHAKEVELDAERDRSATLLRDAHHRMKNSIQMIASLIQLQLAGTGDEKAAAALRELQNRVVGMSLVYDQSRVGDERQTLSSADYLASLLKAIEASYLHPSATLRTTIEDIAIEARFAASLGLIVGELVMNACKYAFPHGAQGSISIEFASEGDSSVSLAVRDDGVGMDAARGRGGRGEHQGIGLELVRSLVAQEKGVIKIDTNSGGTSITCSFPMASQ